MLVQRLCGICPVSHHLAAAKAMDRIVGGEKLTPTAEKMGGSCTRPVLPVARAALLPSVLARPAVRLRRRPAIRNVIGVARISEPRRAGLMMRKYGQRSSRRRPARRSTAPARSPAASTRTCRSPSATSSSKTSSRWPVVARGAQDRQGLHVGTCRSGPVRLVRFEPPVADPAGRRDGPV